MPSLARREGLERPPRAELAGVELDIRLLVDHRERLVRMRSALNNDLLWHLHDLWPEQTLPGSALLANKWATRIGRRPARHEQSARVRIARDASCASSRARLTRSRQRSPSSSRRSRRSCSQSPASAP